MYTLTELEEYNGPEIDCNRYEITFMATLKVGPILLN
jgi:hypothetical protein